MDEAASKDMAVRFVFDADKGLRDIHTLRDGLHQIREGMKQSYGVFQRVTDVMWKILRTGMKLYMLWKAFPVISGAFKNAFMPAAGDMRTFKQRMTFLAKDLSGLFENVFQRKTFATAYNRFGKNISEIAKGERKISSSLTGVSGAAREDIKRNFKGVDNFLTRMGRVNLLKRGPYRMIGSALKALGKAVWNMGKAFKAAGGFIGSAWKWLMKFAKGPVIIAGIVLAVWGAIKIFKKLITVGKEAERSLVKMQIMLGSEKLAIKMYKQVQEFSVRTPFTPAEAARAAAKMTAFGVKPLTKGAYGMDKNIHALQVAAGMASVSGMGLEHATKALLKGEIALLDEYAHAQMVYRKMVKDGMRIGTETFRREFIVRVSKIPVYMKAAEIRSKSVEGLMSTIAGTSIMMWEAMVGAGRASGEIFNFWNSIRRVLSQWAQQGLRTVKFMAPLLREIGATIGLILEAAYEIFQAFQELFKPLLLLIGGALYAAMFAIFRIINIVLFLIITSAKLVGEIAGSIYSWVAGVISTLYYVRKMGEWIFDLFGWVENIVVKIQMLLTFMEFKNRKMGDEIKRFLDIALEVAKSIGVVIERIFDRVMEKIKALVEWIKGSKTIMTMLKIAAAPGYVLKKGDEYIMEGVKKVAGRIDTGIIRDIATGQILNDNRRTSKKTRNQTIIINNPALGEEMRTKNMTGNPRLGFGFGIGQ